MCESTLSINPTIVQIQRCCSHLHNMQIVQYKNHCSLKDLKFLLETFPNTIIKVISIDCNGECNSVNTISKSWLQSLEKHNFLFE